MRESYVLHSDNSPGRLNAEVDPEVVSVPLSREDYGNEEEAPISPIAAQ